MLFHTKIITLFSAFLLVFALSFPAPVLADAESSNGGSSNVSELSKTAQDSVPDRLKEPIGKEDSSNDEKASANEEAENANNVDLTEKDSFSDSKNTFSDVGKDAYRGLTDKDEINKDLVEATPNDSTAPKPEVSSVGNGTVTLTWKPISGATKYAIAEYVNGKYKTFTTECTETTYTISNLSNGKTHYFLVQANVDGKWSDYGTGNHVSAVPEGIMEPSPTASSESGKVTLTWEPVPGATKYAIASKQSDGKYKTYTYDCTETKYTVTGLTNGTTYQFLVQAYIDGKWTKFTNKDLVEATPNDSTAPKPEVSSVGNGTVTLTWKPISGATKYAIAEYVNGKYKTFTTECTETTYTISNLSNGKTHYFLVQANVDGKWSSSSPSMVVEATPHGIIAPQVEAIAGDRSVRLNWESVPGATKYAVAVKQGSGFKTYTLNCTALTYHISGLTSGVKYYFVVQAFVNGKWSSFSSLDYVSATPYGPKLTKEQEIMFNKANNSGYSSYTNYLILVDLSDHKVGVFKGKKNNWKLYYYWDCVTGKASTPTIKGKYSTTGFKRKTLTTDSRARWCTQIWGGYFFHSILASNNELGKSLSHGCIRLSLTAAKWMYDNVKVGTTVVIYK